MTSEVVCHPLWRVDGSAIFSNGLYTVIAGVNGPVEVQRRDELPEKAAVEVNISSLFRTGGPRERMLESVVSAALRSILLTSMHPRTLIQVTLQVAKEPSVVTRKAANDISLLPTLLNSAATALIDGGLPLSNTLTAVLAVVDTDGQVLLDPQEHDIVKSRSIHAVAYNGLGEQLLNESVGRFDADTLDRVTKATYESCFRGSGLPNLDHLPAEAMQNVGFHSRIVHNERARGAIAWRASGPQAASA